MKVELLTSRQQVEPSVAWRGSPVKWDCKHKADLEDLEQNSAKASGTSSFTSFYVFSLHTRPRKRSPAQMLMLVCTSPCVRHGMLCSDHNLFTNSLDGGGRSGAGIFRSYFEPAKGTVSIRRAYVRSVDCNHTSRSSWWSIWVRVLPFF